ncbi:PREDICTED: ficolin-1-like, partial [Branchiostoma belcheri]|uniref:Ficolin-1-like n=1 Tax=Branchiostoma belcheri TaxID=7741 RepID=A0A6P5A5B3_BRABE
TIAPQNCADLSAMGIQTSGTYHVGHPQPFQVSCDMDTDGGGWTVIQRRQDGSVPFDNTWDVYVQGFGDVSEELWIGLEHLHSLTSQQQHELYVYLEDWEGNSKFARYSTFSVGDSTSKYTVTISGFTGDVTDDLTPAEARRSINGNMFSTKDHDNDANSANCAVSFGPSGWWFPESCGQALLNGQYLTGCNPYCPWAQGIVWEHWHANGMKYSLKKTVMMIRPSGFPASPFNTCQNGGTMAEGTPGTGVYTCTCPADWEWAFCEQAAIDDCASSPCTHGTCVDGLNSYSCNCEAGWEGVNCETGINECSSSPCTHGTCIDGLNSYTCTCEAGWTGDNCATVCLN